MTETATGFKKEISLTGPIHPSARELGFKQWLILHTHNQLAAKKISNQRPAKAHKIRSAKASGRFIVFRRRLSADRPVPVPDSPEFSGTTPSSGADCA